MFRLVLSAEYLKLKCLSTYIYIYIKHFTWTLNTFIAFVKICFGVRSGSFVYSVDWLHSHFQDLMSSEPTYSELSSMIKLFLEDGHF